MLLFLLSTIFFFSHITQHSIQNITKQNNRHILNISRSNQKGGGEGRTTRTQKSLLYTITYIKQKTLPSYTCYSDKLKSRFLSYQTLIQQQNNSDLKQLILNKCQKNPHRNIKVHMNYIIFQEFFFKCTSLQY